MQAAQLLNSAWLAPERAVGGGAGARSDPLLEGAHGRLNAWYDGFLFETMSARLELML